MIFVTTGTCKQFDRLIRHIDSIAPQINEKIIAQIGNSTHTPQNIEWGRFYPSIDSLIDKARIVISHGGFSCLEIIKSETPLIVVPRQKQYAEHFDDHQVEFAELLSKKYNTPYFLKTTEINAELIYDLQLKQKMNQEPLELFRSNIISILKER